MRYATLLPVEHGGSLAQAAAQFPHAPRPFTDLSTGINPHPYPFFDLPASTLTRLPEQSRIAELCSLAATTYGAQPKMLVAAPGTQILLPLVAQLVPAGRAAILGPTY
jgi:cobalamin biosynthetic protein CobC